MSSNRGVVYLGQGKVEVQVDRLSEDGRSARPRDRPRGDPQGGQHEHLRLDQHMVRGRTTAQVGLVLGPRDHGRSDRDPGRDVETLAIGDLVSVPFNVACGRCPTARRSTRVSAWNVNPSRAGGAYGYVDMGGWIGGQAEYVMVPYADFNLLKFPDRAQAMSKIRDLTCLSDILPTGYHGAVMAGVKPGATVYVAGAGPVGMAAAASARLLGGACAIVGDMNEERLAHARKMGFETVDLSKDATLGEQIEQISTASPKWIARWTAWALKRTGTASSGHSEEAPAMVLNSLMEITRAAGAIGIPGLYP